MTRLQYSIHCRLLSQLPENRLLLLSFRTAISRVQLHRILSPLATAACDSFRSSLARRNVVQISTCRSANPDVFRTAKLLSLSQHDEKLCGLLSLNSTMFYFVRQCVLIEGWRYSGDAQDNVFSSNFQCFSQWNSHSLPQLWWRWFLGILVPGDNKISAKRTLRAARQSTSLKAFHLKESV